MSRIYKYTAMQAYHGLQRPGGNGGLGSLGPKPPPWSKGGRASSYSVEVLADNPVYYARQESGELGKDSSVNGYDADSVNSVTEITGAVNGAGDFAGTTSSYIEVLDATNIQDLATTDLTITAEAWVKMDSTGSGGAIAAKFNTATTGGWMVWLDATGTPYIRIFSQGVSADAEDIWKANAVVSQDTWVHVAATATQRGGNTAKFYINGVDVGSTQTANSISSALSDAANSLFLGIRKTAGGLSLPFDGGLDEIALYNTALSAARILAHYDAGI